MKHGKQHTFTIVDDRILRERRDKSNTILRLLAACALRALQACPTHFYEYPNFYSMIFGIHGRYPLLIIDYSTIALISHKCYH